MILNALILWMYFDKSGNDVFEDPPSLLIIIGLINTLVLNFFVWVLMVLLLPLVPGGRKGGSSGGGHGGVHGGGHGGSSKSKKKKIKIPKIYRNKKYYFFGPKIEEKRPSITEFWRIGMGSSIYATYKKTEVENAKKKIIDLIFEEEIVPSLKYLREISKIEHPLIDFALDELLMEEKIKYVKKTSSHYWSNGYCLTDTYKDLLKKERGEIDKKKIEKEFNEKLEIFLKKVKENEPIKTKYQLWDIAIEIGMKLKWKIVPTLNNLIKKEKKIYYSRKAPRGYYIND
ncbi:MAG: hypothetical protein ACFFC3_02520 [Candidatus Odinarchaeota archaeon]